MAAKEMTIKLMIDPESDRLIFAEASKDFVDFLIFLLSLPIGTVTKLLSDESMVGSIGNIYTSVANLDEAYLRPNVKKTAILNPMVVSSPMNTPLSAATRSYINSSRKFYTCWDPECRSSISNVNYGVECPVCYEGINHHIEFIDKDSEGYVHDVASYMVSDDLSITSISTMSIVSMLNKFNVTKPEERVVKIGTDEALELMKASLQSTTVLTDVFLKRKKIKVPDNKKVSILFSFNGDWVKPDKRNRDWFYENGTGFCMRVPQDISFVQFRDKLYETLEIQHHEYELSVKALFKGNGRKGMSPIEIRNDDSVEVYIDAVLTRSEVIMCVNAEP